jgi:hypothetical protein
MVDWICAMSSALAFRVVVALPNCCVRGALHAFRHSSPRLQGPKPSWGLSIHLWLDCWDEAPHTSFGGSEPHIELLGIQWSSL